MNDSDMCGVLMYHCMVFFFNDTATTEIYTLSLHDALPISLHLSRHRRAARRAHLGGERRRGPGHDPPRLAPARARQDRKSTRLNSSHAHNLLRLLLLKKKQNTTRTCY